MVYRIYVEKRKELANEAAGLCAELRDLLHIEGLRELRVLNRYDAEGLGKELFDTAVRTVFSEPQLDLTYPHLDDVLQVETEDPTHVFAVEYLPGQFDQRADSAAQCIQLISQGEKPTVRSARIYVLFGEITDEELAKIKAYVINPVEAREASLVRPETLAENYEIPTEVETLEGFLSLDEEGLADFVKQYGLAMDVDDIACCKEYFQSENREPTITEIRMIDTYWSDHCRHTTFLTEIDNIEFTDERLQKTYEEYRRIRRELGRDDRPVCFMDIATLAAKYLRENGQLDGLDESEEINACTVKTEIEIDGKKEPWLLLFKNETHNHPTEIEPFGGAATCIGGAIRDPLSGRSYVYAAMRVTGASDPTVPVEETLPGKLPQRKLVTTAAAGYSSYGNQIGLATGIVDELYHPGYVAKHMEIGAVLGAAPEKHVRREVPAAGDVVILLGGSTGRDGIGGATGSSKSHDSHSVETCGAEVQKGNAPEERKLQRLFRNGDACRMIKRCNDFGAGGVSVAIGELADGLSIDLNAVPKKYEGLDGTELAISESQERMAVVVEKKDVEAFLALAATENLQAVPVAEVTDKPRLQMHWNGKTIVDISRDFLNSNGAKKHIDVITPSAKKASDPETEKREAGFAEAMKRAASDLAACSRRGLAERFDSTIGAGTVLMPFGGKRQLTPIQTMVHKFPVEHGHTEDCSFMAWGYDPYLTEADPYRGSYLAVAESVCKLIASGADFSEVYLTFQEYFGRPGKEPKRWGAPFAALLGAFRAQIDLGVAAIGGKDSMSGSFEDLDVPPTLVSFAVTTGKATEVISPEFKEAGHPVVLLSPEEDEDGLPKASSLKALFERITQAMREGKIVSCAVPTGGAAEAVMKMAFGNGLGFAFAEDLSEEELYAKRKTAFVAELCGADADYLEGEGRKVCLLGETTETAAFTRGSESVDAEELLAAYEGKLEPVYPTKAERGKSASLKETSSDRGEKTAACAPAVTVARPKVLIPAFPGTNCEVDSARAVEDAGAEAKILVIRNRTGEDIAKSADDFVKELADAQMIFIPGGFSGGDEPEGSAKFITAFFRNENVKDSVTELLDSRGGLVCGICNGFQALIKLGLVPYGKIVDTDASSPTLTFNTIGRHQSRIVRTRVVSKNSPWLSLAEPEEIYYVPISHGEGRFLASEELAEELMRKGQVATQYVDFEGEPSMDIRHNPNGSVLAIEGITSPDGRVFGKMGHSERKGSNLYRNVPGNYDIRMFESAVSFFR